MQSGKDTTTKVGTAECCKWRAYKRHDGRRTWHACTRGDAQDHAEEGWVVSLCLKVSWPVGAAGELEQPDEALLPRGERVCGLCVRRIGEGRERTIPQPEESEEEVLLARRLVHKANISAGGREAVAQKLAAMVLAECAALSNDCMQRPFLWEVSGDFDVLTAVVRGLLALRDTRD